MAHSNLPKDIGLPIIQEEDVVAQLNSAGEAIAMSREAIVEYGATVADLESRLRSLQADNDSLRAVAQGKYDKGTSGWLGAEPLRLWHDEESSWKAINEQVYTEAANAMRIEVAENKAAAETARAEADVLLIEAERYRLENERLREILAGLGISSLHSVKQQVLLHSGPVVESGAEKPVDEQHGYSLRSRRKRPRGGN